MATPSMHCQTCPLRQGGICALLKMGGSDGAIPTFQEQKARGLLARRGQEPRFAVILCQGHAVRHSQLNDGRRQILSVHRAGDLLIGPELMGAPLRYIVSSMTDVRLALIAMSALQDRISADPRLAFAFLAMAAEYQNRLAELVTDIGRRTSFARISHFFIDMIAWTDSTVADNKCIIRIPHRQEDIADLLGLTTTHVNRVISAMRKQKLIGMRDDIVSILDVATLRASIR